MFSQTVLTVAVLGVFFAAHTAAQTQFATSTIKRSDPNSPPETVRAGQPLRRPNVKS